MPEKSNLVDNLLSSFSCLELVKSESCSTLVLLRDAGEIYKLLCHLKDYHIFSFNLLIAIYGVDYLLQDKEKRFEVIYNLLSMSNNFRLLIKVPIDESESLESVCNIYPSANWYEREVFDMFGIKFENHPSMRRILTDYNFDHHPLRKDFPVFGYQQVRYDAVKQDVVYEDVSLTQEYREFDATSPWGTGK